MEFDFKYIGPQRFTAEDAGYRGSTFAEVRAALFANAYYLVRGGPDEPPLPVYEATLARSLAGLLSRKKPWWFQQASDRTVDSRADLRWGPDGRGFRRILHPNGVRLDGNVGNRFQRRYRIHRLLQGRKPCPDRVPVRHAAPRRVEDDCDHSRWWGSSPDHRQKSYREACDRELHSPGRSGRLAITRHQRDRNPQCSQCHAVAPGYGIAGALVTGWSLPNRRTPIRQLYEMPTRKAVG